MASVVRVLHLVGSPESDFFADLSRLYAADCLAATADPSRYEFLVAYVAPDGHWRFPHSLAVDDLSTATPMPIAAAITRLCGLGIDVMVPQMFCIEGMTRYRSLFDLLGIPYIGNTADLMALTADKAKTKAVVARAGVRVPDGQVLRRGEAATVAPPAVVKPVSADNSVGVSLVRSDHEWDAALARAWDHGPALVETYIELGREVRCGTIVRGGNIVALPLEEYAVDPIHKPVRGEDDKLARGVNGQLHLVAKDSAHSWIVGPADPVTAAVQDAAIRCHEALGCRHYALFDFRVDPAGRPWFLEAGLYCSFATQSVIPVMAKAVGITLSVLFADAIQQALHDGPDRQSVR